MTHSMRFFCLTILIPSAVCSANAFQNIASKDSMTFSSLLSDSADGVRPLPFFDIHFGIAVPPIASRLGLRIQFHQDFSVEAFYGSRNLFIAGPSDHALAGFGVNWHPWNSSSFVVSLIDATEWISGRPDAIPPYNQAFRYHVIFPAVGFLSMNKKTWGLDGFIRGGFGYEIYRGKQGELVHGFNSLILDAGFGIAF
ncbi:MAG: hypothetical protein ACRDGA_13205 [Bacteroidota bacterium]